MVHPISATLQPVVGNTIHGAFMEEPIQQHSSLAHRGVDRSLVRADPEKAQFDKRTDHSALAQQASESLGKS